MRQLHLGCGITAPAGWTNVDGSYQVTLARRPMLRWAFGQLGLLSAEQMQTPWPRNIIRADLTKPLRFPSCSFSAVYSSHTIEHLHRDHALALMRECHRVLEPGGTCRIVIPDLRVLAERYLAATGEASSDAEDFMARLRAYPRAPERGIVGLYKRMTGFHQHKWMYDPASLIALFRQAGFPNARQCDYNESAIATIGEVEHPGRILDGEGIAVEAQRQNDGD